MIEPGAELAELLAGVRAMTDETEHQLAVRLDAADVAHASVIRGEVVSLPHAQELGVPRRAAYRITNVRLTSTRPVIVGTPKSLSAAVASGMPTTSRRWRDYPLARGGIARGVRTVTSKEQSSCSAFGTARAVDGLPAVQDALARHCPRYSRMPACDIRGERVLAKRASRAVISYSPTAHQRSPHHGQVASTSRSTGACS